MGSTTADAPAVWERVALLTITTAACVAYGWGMRDALLEPYYAAAVRSMSLGWRNFVFGAFDPDGSVTLDKLPGAFWPQALCVRAFGVHAWAVVLPQVIEGAFTVVVLYRAVRRLAGPVAGLSAAAVLAVASPVTVALNRGNVPDTLLTLLLVLAADAISSAVRDGRTVHVLLAGLWVGLAFQAKMLQAWLVLPALGVTLALAAPGTGRRRLSQVGALGLVAVAVSLSWMTWVALHPQGSRPHVDGSLRDSVFEQVFAYNGFRRLSGWSPLSRLAQLGLGSGLFEAPPASWSRLVTGAWGRAIGWALPAAVIATFACTLARRRAPRADHLRACVLLWGSWLVVFGVAFSATSTGWPYYGAVLSPAIAALLGVGFTALVLDRGRSALLVLALVVAIGAVHAAWLLPAEGTGLPPWLRPALVVVAASTEVVVAAALLWVRARAALAAASVACAAGALLLVPVVASFSIVAHEMGPFDTPFQPRARTAGIRRQLTRVPDLARVERTRGGARYLLAAYPAGLASRYIFFGGQSVLPIGGLTGTMPEPSLARLRASVASGELHLVIALPADDPRYAWIASSCSFTGRVERAELYYCRPADAAPR